MDIISQFSISFNSPIFQNVFFAIKIVFVLFGAIFLVSIALMLVRTQWINYKYLFDFSEFLTFRPYGMRRITKTWAKVRGRLEGGDEAEYKLAVIDADSMLEDTLKRLGIAGQTLQERLLSIVPTIIPNIDDVKKAHETRDSIVHNPNYQLSLREAEKTLDIFEEAFRSLDLI